MSDEEQGGWSAFYDATSGRPPRRTLLFALERFDAAQRAVDLGCGDGRDTIELLRRGWSVTAIDAEPTAIARLTSRSDLPAAVKLTALCGKFEALSWPPAELVNASFALPLCPPDAFPNLWQKIATSLVQGGRFAGQLYGPRDDWAAKGDITILNEERARQLFAADYTIELFDEEETDAVTPRGKKKHWHIFHIVARKR